MSRFLTLALCVVPLLAACHKKAPVTSLPTSLPVPEVAATTPPVPPEVIAKLKENFQRVYFETDSAQLTADSKAALTANAKLLREYGNVAIEIEGFCDERATTEYNLALGDKRANAVRTYLVNQGVSGDRLRAISFGEERPVATGHDERAWALNRRAEFRILDGFDDVNGTAS